MMLNVLVAITDTIFERCNTFVSRNTSGRTPPIRTVLHCPRAFCVTSLNVPPKAIGISPTQLTNLDNKGFSSLVNQIAKTFSPTALAAGNQQGYMSSTITTPVRESSISFIPSSPTPNLHLIKPFPTTSHIFVGVSSTLNRLLGGSDTCLS